MTFISQIVMCRVCGKQMSFDITGSGFACSEHYFLYLDQEIFEIGKFHIEWIDNANCFHCSDTSKDRFKTIITFLKDFNFFGLTENRLQKLIAIS